MASALPRHQPCSTTACTAYSEQLGVKRQELPNTGDIQRLYQLSKNSTTYCVLAISPAAVCIDYVFFAARRRLSAECCLSCSEAGAAFCSITSNARAISEHIC